MGTFQQLKEALEEQLVQLSGLPELKTAAIHRLLEKLRQNCFHLVVLGAFKRGKKPASGIKRTDRWVFTLIPELLSY